MRYLDILLLLSLLYITKAFQCDEISGSTCTLKSVNTNETYQNLKVTPNNEITTVRFNNCKMHTFTKDVCEAFPNLTHLVASELFLKKVASDALTGCLHLYKVYFNVNLLETVDANLFEKNFNVEYISFAYNRLRTIEGRLFEPLLKLHSLLLQNNFLSELPLQDFPELQYLNHVIIDYNDIRHLDEWMLVSKFPNLKTIDLRRNLIDCDRLRAIINLLDSKNITYHQGFVKRDRGRRTDKFKGIDCMNPNETIQGWNEEEKMTNSKLENLNGTVVELGEQMFAFSMAFVAFVVLDLIFFAFFAVLVFKLIRKIE